VLRHNTSSITTLKAKRRRPMTSFRVLAWGVWVGFLLVGAGVQGGGGDLGGLVCKTFAAEGGLVRAFTLPKGGGFFRCVGAWRRMW